MQKTILILNGPNLNRLGKREPGIYGSETLADLEERLSRKASAMGYAIEACQSNHEGELIDWIHRAEDEGAAGIIMNPGAFTHYSYAIRDAVAAVDIPFIEVHISNIHARESFRHTSVIAPEALGQIAGFGFLGYEMAMDALDNYRMGRGK
ncbi:3-dehydroquinate dehydratase [Rossellomorea marisflavi]|uniref:type II 3-dehydroquinate dehydratase n=1 Tax=Rossellomorea marisflavi TaxID=189381 RepID=UPI0025C8A4CF|nr:type II 3-dehydroquinate dehydratase [Rossellomorea marisflavi]UTE74429.1 type II 3-dehydroquinate dehydratase [Rossellomorea marisflavi]GLI83293.1 3-dehydroquinate dehydratase [Rossellomorea marisflavi]